MAIKAAMAIVLSSYELVNLAYYVLLPWDTLSSNNAVAVAAASALFGRPAAIFVTVLVALSCAGSIASNVFAIGRLTVAASQRHYLPAFLSRRGLPRSFKSSSPGSSSAPDEEDSPSESTYDAPM
jgi:amino acid transporter